MEPTFGMVKNERGIALIIVLLVTALLVALVFEFAYSTRVSMRAAMNFRDSQRAYFLARSGINYLWKTLDFKDPQCPTDIPVAAIAFQCEDESAKINVYEAKNPNVKELLKEFFRLMQVDPNVAEKIASDNSQVLFLTDLHRYLNEEEYRKVAPFLTANKITGTLINANTANEIVLHSVLQANTNALNTLLSTRKNKKLTSSDIPSDFKILTVESSGVKIISSATVGDYTKAIEVIMNSSSFDYWKSL